MPAQLTIIQYTVDHGTVTDTDEYTTIADCKTVAHHMAGNDLVWSEFGGAQVADFEKFRFIAKKITFKESRYNF